MAENLFAAAAEVRLASSAPLAARLRPRSLDEVVGQEHLLGPGKPLRRLIESDRLSSVILWGPPGTGKTSVVRLIAGATCRDPAPRAPDHLAVPRRAGSGEDVRQLSGKSVNHLQAGGR